MVRKRRTGESHKNVPADSAVLQWSTQLAAISRKSVRVKDAKLAMVDEWRELMNSTTSEALATNKMQVPGALGGQDVHFAPSITDGNPPPLAGNDHSIPW